MSPLTGVVIEVHAARCRVQGDDGEAVDCTYRKRLGRGRRRETNVLVVGDHVRYALTDDGGVVEEVLPRRNALGRKATKRTNMRHVFAANLDQALIVVAVRQPLLRTGFVDRCLAAAHRDDIAGVVVLNKIDLLDEAGRAEVDAVATVYAEAGIPIHRVSVVDGIGVDAVRDRLRGQVSVVVGPSGAGKSSLINAVQPGLRLRTGEVSESSAKGIHTTTSSRLLPLDGGGHVVDTPGVRAFGLEEMDPPDILLAYPELAAYAPDCRFSACSHDHEPACAIRAAAEAGAVPGWRYENYLRILHSIGENEPLY